MGLLRFLLNFMIAMALWTTLGQLSFKGQKLETRYHLWVNSPAMQGVFDTAFYPARWSSQKLSSLWNDLTPSSRSQAR